MTYRQNNFFTCLFSGNKNPVLSNKLKTGFSFSCTIFRYFHFSILLTVKIALKPSRLILMLVAGLGLRSVYLIV